jgi:hypothetical protein
MLAADDAVYQQKGKTHEALVTADGREIKD